MKTLLVRYGWLVKYALPIALGATACVLSGCASDIPAGVSFPTHDYWWRSE